MKSAWPSTTSAGWFDALGHAMPEQHAMVPGVGDGEHAVAKGDAGRHVERRGADLAFGVAAFAGEIGLADDEVGRRPIGCGQRAARSAAGDGRCRRRTAARPAPARQAPRGPNSVSAAGTIGGGEVGADAAERRRARRAAPAAARAHVGVAARRASETPHGQRDSRTSTRSSITRTACNCNASSGAVRHSPLARS